MVNHDRAMINILVLQTISSNDKPNHTVSCSPTYGDHNRKKLRQNKRPKMKECRKKAEIQIGKTLKYWLIVNLHGFPECHTRNCLTNAESIFERFAGFAVTRYRDGSLQGELHIDSGSH